jgi:hypothetical protein
MKSAACTPSPQEVGALRLDLGDDCREVLVTRVDRLGLEDGRAVLRRLGRERLCETLSVGLLVVDDRDLLLAERLHDVLGRERALDVVGGADAEVALVGPGLRAARGERPATGEVDTGVGR